MIEYIITIIFILFIDFIWIFSNSKNYNSLVEKVQKTPLSINYIGAFLSYIIFICGLFFFSIPLIEIKLKENKNLLILSLFYGGGLGLLLYGMFNATNYGIFTNYNYKIALLDTFWGFIIFTISSYLFISIKHILYIKSI
jgi:uncharacterized membrane protein